MILDFMLIKYIEKKTIYFFIHINSLAFIEFSTLFSIIANLFDLNAVLISVTKFLLYNTDIPFKYFIIDCKVISDSKSIYLAQNYGITTSLTQK